jgi:ABC-2 type transport system ATP-binding protein
LKKELSVLRASGLSKRYSATKVVLSECHCQVSAGESIALIGANGAGKTTLLNLFLGTATATTGEVFWFERPIARCIPGLYDDVAFVPEEHRFYSNWTGEQTVSFVRSFHPRWSAVQESAFRGHLNIPLSQKIRTYSKGNLAKLSLLLAMSQGAKVFLLDEPFSGLDPLIREELVQVLSATFRELDSTVIMTAHDLFAAEALAKTMWVVHQGRFLFQGATKDFIESYRSIIVEEEGIPSPGIRAYRRQAPPGEGRNLDQYILPTASSEEILSRTLSQVRLLENRRATLHEAYAACVYLSEKGLNGK